jgi:Domain of unknown function (DUF4276)
MFHGVLAEDPSDTEALAVFIRRLRAQRRLPNVKIKQHGSNGKDALFRKGAVQFSAWEKAGCECAVVCADADRNEPGSVLARIEKEIIEQSGIEITSCAVVPTQELEAWLLADIDKLGQLFNWCTNLPKLSNPERVQDPKESLIRLSEHPKKKKRFYSPPTHNIVMAGLVDLDLLTDKCPSFARLAAFIDEA